MKNITLVISLFLTLTLLDSCNESYIDLSPLSQISSNGFYQTQEDINVAVIGLYDGLQRLYRPGYLDNFSEIRSDNTINYFTTVSGGMLADFDNFSVSPSNNRLNDYWVMCYEGIQRANVILNRIDDVEMDETLKSSFSGETKFIRALFYFDLVRFFGGVPLVLEEITDPTIAFTHTRATEEEIYTQIIKDLSEAINSLPQSISDADFGRSGKWAAKGILAKVYLTKKMYSEAETQLKDIIASGKYTLEPSFSNIFNYTTNGNSEIIFAIRFKNETNSEGYPYQNVNHDFGNSASPNFMFTFSNDPRLDATIDTSNVGLFYTPKIISSELGNDNTTNVNIVVLRMADIHLMLAEVLNETGGQSNQIFNNLNLVRNRAGLESYNTTDHPTKESIRLAIAKERRIEFAFENQRWFDLVRTDKAVEVMSKANLGGSNTSSGSALPYTMNEDDLLYPIPQKQIDASGGTLIQNKGY